jgi:DNA-binding NtrC family response regulator
MLEKDSQQTKTSAFDASTRERIFVIDDETRICDSLRELLIDSGYEVITFQNSDEAANEIRTGQFDLIISDIKMPGLSGLDLLRLARNVDPQALVVLMTISPVGIGY